MGLLDFQPNQTRSKYLHACSLYIQYCECTSWTRVKEFSSRTVYGSEKYYRVTFPSLYMLQKLGSREWQDVNSLHTNYFSTGFEISTPRGISQWYWQDKSDWNGRTLVLLDPRYFDVDDPYSVSRQRKALMIDTYLSYFERYDSLFWWPFITVVQDWVSIISWAKRKIWKPLYILFIKLLWFLLSIFGSIEQKKWKTFQALRCLA